MKYILPTLLVVCLLIGCSSSPASFTPTALPTLYPTRSTLSGFWLGAITDSSSATQSVLIDFNASPPTINIEPLTRVWNLETVQNGETLQFSVVGKTTDPFMRIEFNGTYQNGSLTGATDWDGVTGRVTFMPIVAVDAGVLEKNEGLYRFDSGRALSVIVSPSYEQNGLRFFAEGLTMTDFSTGDMRALYAFDEITFAVGALRTTGQPFEGRIQFIRDGSGGITGLDQWESLEASAAPEHAQRVPFTQEDVTFTSADAVVLAGRVWRPVSSVPVAAFVELHGSEQGTRDNFSNKLMAHFMISRGIAILTTDKRGVGESGGIYQEAASETNMARLAGDALAGVDFLAGQSAIDAKRIGLIGYSQAGWIIPLAASQSDRVAFFVNLSGPAVSVSQEDAYSTATDDGDSVVNYDAEALDARVRTMKPGGFNPLPIISHLNQPGLWLWGGVDKSIPVTVSAENLQTIIVGGKNNFAYQIFPQADHNLNQSAHGLFNEIPFAPRVVFYQALDDWLKQFVLVQE